MKTILLKKKNILFFIFSAFFASQTLSAQGNSSNEPDDSMQSFRLEFNSVDGPEVRRELHLSFSESTTDGFDEGYDTKNLDVLPDDLNLVLDGELMLAQAYGPISEDKSVPLVLQSSGSYNYTIQLTSTENMGGQNVHLRDNLTGAYFNITNGQIYEFSSEEGNFPNRFEILFKSVTLSQTSFDLENINIQYANDSNTIVVLNPKNQRINSIEVYNISGQLVYNNLTLNDESSVRYQTRNLNTGVYIIRLETENNGLFTKKFIAK